MFKNKYKKDILFFILACIFAFFALLYQPLTTEESLCPLYDSGFHIAKTLFLFALYTFLFYAFLVFFYHFFNTLTPDARTGFLPYYKKAAILALLWLPHIIAAYPGSITPDASTQLGQFMGYEPLTAHHPPVHTFLIGICARLGKQLFHSYNIGIFLYVLMQYLAMLLIFTYTIHYLEKRGTPVFMRRALWVIYSLCPLIVGFVGVVLKDVIYSSFFVLFIIFCVRFMESPSFCITLSDAVGLIGSGICVILLRNNGKYVIYPMCLILFLTIVIHNFKDIRQWIKALSVLLLPAAISFLILHALISAYHIAPGSIREALSFPFQQTARTVNKHADEIPEEEKEAIDKVLEYSKIGRWYDYKICDPVKLTYREGASREDLLHYFKTWLKECKRYPTVYFTATLMQNYPLLCIFDDNSYYYCDSHIDIEYCEDELTTPIPEIEKINEAFYRFYYAIHKIPVFGLIAHMSFYCILLFVLTAYAWRGKKYRLFLPLLPLWLSFGICILAPAITDNARYAFPICYSIPFLFGCYLILPSQKTRHS